MKVDYKWTAERRIRSTCHKLRHCSKPLSRLNPDGGLDEVFVSEMHWARIAQICGGDVNQSIARGLAMYLQGAALVALGEEIGDLQARGSLFITVRNLILIDSSGCETTASTALVSLGGRILIVDPNELPLGPGYYVDRQLIRVEIARADQRLRMIREIIRRDAKDE